MTQMRNSSGQLLLENQSFLQRLAGKGEVSCPDSEGVDVLLFPLSHRGSHRPACAKSVETCAAYGYVIPVVLVPYRAAW